MLLLLSRCSRVRLCATTQTAAHQAPPSLGFSRQEHWSGLPFPSLMHERKCESEVAQSCPTLSNRMDCGPPGSSVHGIFQARVPEWGAIAFSPFSPQLSTKLTFCLVCCLLQQFRNTLQVKAQICVEAHLSYLLLLNYLSLHCLFLSVSAQLYPVFVWFVSRIRAGGRPHSCAQGKFGSDIRATGLPSPVTPRAFS